MRLPTRIHGMLDYLMGALLIASPWLLGFADNEAARWVPVVLGAGVLLYSLFTDYELGAVRKLQMPAHLLLDAVGGILLAASPWILGFDERVWMPHVVLGAVEVVTAAITNTVPGYERRRAAR
ncbi:SPW repeat protein [Longimicrobium sp.]|uniref:SPW repeat protein n=1 Tax=Longimicrobium sp. TaxID=2029185 RepID=UPI002E334B4B|nr:SPW repeat protein [Longimicrobium sp.]HEX6041193.1 SPW repeat protein [Longimicrobium sp.]